MSEISKGLGTLGIASCVLGAVWVTGDIRCLWGLLAVTFVW